jgi:orotidine-5'-phosphate decarboxylase
MKQAKDFIIFPLDVPTLKEAAGYIASLSGHVGMFKVGLELFIQSGPKVIRMIQESGDARIFLDLKLHDIPATVARAMARIADLGVRFASAHCGETPRMLEAAVKGGGGRVGVLGITVLTSVSSGDIEIAGFKEEFARDMSKLVLNRAGMAKAAGCAGVVCSGKEVRMIKEIFGDQFVTVTPGIRPVWAMPEGDDQRRVVTPAKAIEDGADFLVIGRPIRDALDPVSAVKRIADEIASARSPTGSPYA